MSLLREIKHGNRHAASVLEKAKLHTDSAILSLTREDLRDLFPKAEDFQLRRTLFDTIHKQPIAEQLLKRLKGFVPRASLRAAQTNNGVLVDYLHLMKDMRTQMDGQRSFIDAHIRFLEEMSADQVDSPRTDGCSQEHGGSGTSDAGGQQTVLTDGYPQGEIMSLLREIKHGNRRAASVLEKAKLHTDSAILSLTREDLRDLFPKAEDFQLRRILFDTIHKQPIAEQLLKRLKGFVPRASLRAALTNNGVLVDYLHLMKDMRTQMDGQRSFIDAHIRFLEELSADQVDSPQTDGCSQEHGGSGTSDAGVQQTVLTDGYPQGPVGHPRFQRGDYSQGAQALHSGTSASATGGPVGGQSGGSPRKAPGSGASYVGDQRNQPAGSTGDSHESDAPYSGTSASATGGPVGGQCGGFPQKAPGSGASDVDGQRNQPAGSTGDSREYDGSGASDGDDQRNLPAGSTGDSHESDESFTFLDCEETLLYKMVVGGKTFDIHKKLMEKVKKQVKNRIRLCDDKQDYKLTFVFCPISSRIGADVEAAMADIRDDKPIILVLMHHTREVKPVTSMKTWPDGANVVLRVNVFFHETTGLLKCEQNDAAVVEIKNILLQHYIQGSNDTSGDA